MLSIAGVSKWYGSTSRTEPLWVLDDINLDMATGEVLTIVGPSGCGKSTLLKCVAGLEPYDSGSVSINGGVVRSPGVDRSMVFQQPSLLPWRTAEGNVAFGMQMQRVHPSRHVADSVRSALDLVGLSEFKDYFPGQLSGGMQQRVNLARALATDPEVLLMDEPFGALDALTKERLHLELVRIADRTGKTILFITHDIEEAIFLSDRVCVMTGPPGRITADLRVPFERPRTEDVYRDPAFQEMRYEIRGLLGNWDKSGVA